MGHGCRWGLIDLSRYLDMHVESIVSVFLSEVTLKSARQQDGVFTKTPGVPPLAWRTNCCQSLCSSQMFSALDMLRRPASCQDCRWSLLVSVTVSGQRSSVYIKESRCHT